MLLNTLWIARNALLPSGDVSMRAVLPAAPAAVRFMLKGFQSCSRLQLLRQQHSGAQYLNQLQQQAGFGCLFITSCPSLAYEAMRVVALAGATMLVPPHPGAEELLLSPELVSCLAILLVVTFLGLDTSSAAGPQSSSGNSEAGSSTSHQAPSTQQPQQQQASSSSAGSRGGSGGGLANGIQLDSLTPLSCSLFDILGIPKEAAVQFAGLAKSEGRTTVARLAALMQAYREVLVHQVTLKPPALCFYGDKNVTRRHIRHTAMALPTGI
jgi:hypothetical protein